ncbi:hypothetical protein [Burkholderia lata]|uniref:hypothetical protein n=1 Tax=Burkholderia lata (strain ATCC 17760 / DSM 23089 / LMG 22485 / NCIMB 9086 / R18194 / 383) TaxID=482957 RepID=UPI0015839BA1
MLPVNAGSMNPGCSRRFVERAKLVAVRIAHVGEVKRAERRVPFARRIFARAAAMRECGGVKCFDLLDADDRKPDGSAIGDRGWLAVERRRDDQQAIVVLVHDAR